MTSILHTIAKKDDAKQQNHTKELVLFVLIPEYADWEASLLIPSLSNGGFGMWDKTFNIKVVAPSMSPVSSIGGVSVMPDDTFDTAPKDFAALILVGGNNWFSEDAKRVLPMIHQALANNAVIGAICDASKFLGVNGFLNHVEHTSNDLEGLKNSAASLYTGESQYKDLPSVLDGNMVTANGLGFIEFTKHVLLALRVARPETIETFFQICKRGYY